MSRDPCMLSKGCYQSMFRLEQSPFCKQLDRPNATLKKKGTVCSIAESDVLSYKNNITFEKF